MWEAPETVAKDPNVRVQEAIALLFAKFRETWSIRQTFKWFRDNDVPLPVTKVVGTRQAVVLQVPRPSFIASVLHNPFYAGAYAWGRHGTEPVWRAGVLRKRRTAVAAPEQAGVLVRGDQQQGRPPAYRTQPPSVPLCLLPFFSNESLLGRCVRPE